MGNQLQGVSCCCTKRDKFDDEKNKQLMKEIRQHEARLKSFGFHNKQKTPVLNYQVVEYPREKRYLSGNNFMPLNSHPTLKYHTANNRVQTVSVLDTPHYTHSNPTQNVFSYPQSESENVIDDFSSAEEESITSIIPRDVDSMIHQQYLEGDYFEDELVSSYAENPEDTSGAPDVIIDSNSSVKRSSSRNVDVLGLFSTADTFQDEFRQQNMSYASQMSVPVESQQFRAQSTTLKKSQKDQGSISYDEGQPKKVKKTKKGKKKVVKKSVKKGAPNDAKKYPNADIISDLNNY